MAATTWAEYKKHIEKDPALTRRFQVVQVDEPSEHKAILMMRGVASTMEKHHQVQILDEALEAAVRLSHRYIPARQLPDKSVSLLDTACARTAISLHAVPAEVDDSRRRIEALETELAIIRRERHRRRHRRTPAQRRDPAGRGRERLAALEQRWAEENAWSTNCWRPAPVCVPPPKRWTPAARRWAKARRVSTRNSARRCMRGWPNCRRN